MKTSTVYQSYCERYLTICIAYNVTVNTPAVHYNVTHKVQ